jgi:PAS domain S-box-containing protein
VLSLSLMYRLREEAVGRRLRRNAAAVAMGVAISGMHYTAMAAVTFTASGEPPDLSRSMYVSSLGAAAIAVFVMMALVAVSFLFMMNRLQHQRVLLDELFEQSPEPVALTSLDGRVVRVNRAFTRVFSYAKPEVVGRMLIDLIVPAEAKDEAAREAERLARGERVDAEGILERKDGARLHVSKVHVPVSVPGKQIAVYAMYRDMSDRVRAEQRLRRSHEQLRALAARVQSLREEERSRISREVHDDLGQRLTALSMELHWIEQRLGELEDSSEVRAILERVIEASEIVKGLILAVQEIAAELRPNALDKLGLAAALRDEAGRFQKRTGIVCEIRLPDEDVSLLSEQAIALFRIFQECLTNVVRHAGATRVDAELRTEDGWVVLVIHDDGRGIQEAEIANAASLGLLGIRERAAILGGESAIERAPTGGTTVTVRIPRARPRERPGSSAPNPS